MVEQYKCKDCGVRLPDNIMRTPMRIVPRERDLCPIRSRVYHRATEHFPVPDRTVR